MLTIARRTRPSIWPLLKQHAWGVSLFCKVLTNTKHDKPKQNLPKFFENESKHASSIFGAFLKGFGLQKGNQTKPKIAPTVIKEASTNGCENWAPFLSIFDCFRKHCWIREGVWPHGEGTAPAVAREEGTAGGTEGGREGERKAVRQVSPHHGAAPTSGADRPGYWRG